MVLLPTVYLITFTFSIHSIHSIRQNPDAQLARVFAEMAIVLLLVILKFSHGTRFSLYARWPSIAYRHQEKAAKKKQTLLSIPMAAIVTTTHAIPTTTIYAPLLLLLYISHANSVVAE